MNSFTIEGNWKEMTGKLKQQFAHLTDNDLLFEKGQEEELVGKLEKSLGKTREDVRRLLKRLE